MTKNEFMELDIDSKVDYLNSKLKEGHTVIRIREDLGIGEKYLQRELKNNGYKFNKKDKMYDKEHTISLSNNEPINNIQEAKEHTISIPNNLRDDLIEILDMKNDLKQVIEVFKKGYDKNHTQIIEIVEDKGIKINLPNDKIVRTTVRANNTVLNLWNEFCNENKEFSKQDLISMAMLEYIDKYKFSKQK